MTVVIRPYLSVLVSGYSIETANLPDFIQNMVGDFSALERLKTDNAFYLFSQWFGKNMGQFLPLCVLMLTFPLFSREADKKTIYFLLSRIKREKVFFAKYTTVLTSIIIMLLIFAGGAPVLMTITGYPGDYTKTVPLFFQQVIACWFFFSLFVLYSVAFYDQIKPVILGIVTVFILPVLGLYKPLSFLNPYPFLFGNSVVASGAIDGFYAFGLCLVSIALSLIAFFYFRIKEY
jgi:ABC-type transport system involved in multi-copper enzyme maturation permease subunit